MALCAAGRGDEGLDHLAGHRPPTSSAEVARDPISWMSKGRLDPPAATQPERTMWRGLAAVCSCPPVSLEGRACTGVGGEEWHCVFPEWRSSQSGWQETAGAVGRGRLVPAPPRARQPSASGGGAAGGPGIDDLRLGESETCHLLILGASAKGSLTCLALWVQAQMLRPRWGCDLSHKIRWGPSAHQAGP